MTSLTIAALTVRDLIRRRVFVILGLFALGLILLSFPLRQLTVGQWYRLITDVGLGAADLSIGLIAILLGATLIAGDLDRRTLHPLLAKPMSRSSFVVGKFLGLAAVMVSLTAAMWIGTTLVLLLAEQRSFTLPLLQAFVGVAAHAVVVGALAVMFSCFTSVTLAATFGLSLLLLGHLTDNLAYFGEKADSALLRDSALVIARGLPNLELLNLKTLASHGTTIPWSNLLTRVSYGSAYALVALAFGAWLFSGRDLK